ncbi:MAG: glycine cleavage system protein GcvH [Nocardioidaceae bacterium]
MTPEDLKYTPEHEWVSRPDGDTVRIGITDFAQESLGDIVYVHLPDVGQQVEAGEPMGELESTKSVSDLFSPVSGAIASRNDALDASPELCNSDPYGDGWIVEIEVSDMSQIEGLLSADAYGATVTSK